MWSQTGFPGVFVTLTYADENLPPGGSLVKVDAQRFMKRLRFAYQSDTGRFLRFYLVGEYGEQKGRPHYHVILFGVDPQWMTNHLPGIWGLGFVHVGTITEGSIAYVADYSLKVLKNASCSSDGKIPQFRLMSRRPGIGGSAWAGVADSLRGEGVADDLDVKGGPREVRVPSSIEGKSELLPLDRYTRLGVEKRLNMGGRSWDNFSRLLAHAYSRPFATPEELEKRRRGNAAQALLKKARRARKAKL